MASQCGWRGVPTYHQIFSGYAIPDAFLNCELEVAAKPEIRMSEPFILSYGPNRESVVLGCNFITVSCITSYYVFAHNNYHTYLIWGHADGNNISSV